MSGVREKFEAWARKSDISLHLAYERGRGYLDCDTWKAFESWQASREAALEEAAAHLRQRAEMIAQAEKPIGLNTRTANAEHFAVLGAVGELMKATDAILALKKDK